MQSQQNRLRHERSIDKIILRLQDRLTGNLQKKYLVWFILETWSREQGGGKSQIPKTHGWIRK